MATYTKEPRITISKKNGNCNACTRPVGKGTTIVYDPISRKVYCPECGKKKHPNLFINQKS